MKNVLIYPNPSRDKGLSCSLAAHDILQKRGVQTLLPKDPAINPALFGGAAVMDFEQAVAGCDLILAFGGDGTILSLAKNAARYEKPILGINLGNLGFMAEVEPEELELINQVLDKEFVIEKRMMFDVVVKTGEGEIFRDVALNDAVLYKAENTKIIHIMIEADGKTITRFTGDGVILATPTGSTAYSMSAGGPIVEPEAEITTVTPICAHALFAKSFVLDAHKPVCVVAESTNAKPSLLSVDGGLGITITPSEKVLVSQSRYFTQLIRLKELSFYQRIGKKLQYDFK